MNKCWNAIQIFVFPIFQDCWRGTTSSNITVQQKRILILIPCHRNRSNESGHLIILFAGLPVVRRWGRIISLLGATVCLMMTINTVVLYYETKRHSYTANNKNFKYYLPTTYFIYFKYYYLNIIKANMFLPDRHYI